MASRLRVTGGILFRANEASDFLKFNTSQARPIGPGLWCLRPHGTTRRQAIQKS
jgi:hypothetical protein